MGGLTPEGRRMPGKHARALSQIVSVYMGGPGLLTALEVYVENQCSLAKIEGEGKVAENVCLGLHPSPPDQILCAQCVEAEKMIPTLVSTSMEVQKNLRAREGE